jgi:hypothetical protein
VKDTAWLALLLALLLIVAFGIALTFQGILVR